MYLGDFVEDSTHDFTFTTRAFATGAPATLSGSPAVSVYKANSTAQSTAGVTLTVDFDGVTGLNHVRIDTAADAFYAVANDYSVIITAGTSGGTSVVGETVGAFSIENRFREADLVAIQGDAQSAADLKDFADAGYDPATNKVQGVVLTDTATAVTNDVGITQGGADKVWLSAARTLSSFGTLVADIWAAVVDSAGVTTLLSRLTAGRATNLDNLDATVSSRLATAGYTAPPSVGAIADGVWDEALAGHAGAGSAGAALSAAGSAGDPWATALPGAYGAGTAGAILGTNLDATVSSRASQASVNTIDDLLDTEVAALQTSVNDLPTNAELATALGTADDAVLAAIAALNNLSAAQVNAEVLDVLSTDVQTELAALPAAATTLTNMLKTLYAYTTNEVRETSSLQTLRNRANSATIAQHSVTDDGTQYVRGSGS